MAKKKTFAGIQPPSRKKAISDDMADEVFENVKPTKKKYQPTQSKEAPNKEVPKEKPKRQVKAITIEFPQQLYKDIKFRAVEEAASFRSLVVRYCRRGLKEEE